MRNGLLGLLLVISPAAQAAQLAGRLAYLHDGAAYVAGADYGAAQKLPQSDEVLEVVLTPDRGVAYYLVRNPAAGEEARRLMRSAPPYAEAESLAGPWDTGSTFGLFCCDHGNTLFLTVGDGGIAWDIAAGSPTTLPFPPLAASADGQVVVYQNEKETRVRNLDTKVDKVLFSIGQPQALFTALRGAKDPENLKDLSEAIDPELYRHSYNWAVGTPSILPDGSRVFLPVNAGVGQGAAGNTVYAFVAIDVADQKILPLSKVGAQYGRVPYGCRVSPDARRLLYLRSMHHSAAENPCGLHILDLFTQQDQELLWTDAEVDAELTNLVDGVTWAPDSRHLAVAVHWYDPLKMMQGELSDPTSADFQLRLYDVVTGQIRRQIVGAVQPGWGGG